MTEEWTPDEILRSIRCGMCKQLIVDEGHAQGCPALERGQQTSFAVIDEEATYGPPEFPTWISTDAVVADAMREMQREKQRYARAWLDRWVASHNGGPGRLQREDAPVDASAPGGAGGPAAPDGGGLGASGDRHGLRDLAPRWSSYVRCCLPRRGAGHRSHG